VAADLEAATSHMQGAKKMVQLRGGTAQLGMDGFLGMMVTWLGLYLPEEWALT